MAGWDAYQQEQIVLAYPLKFGSQAALAVLPKLTPDKFVYGLAGNLGGTEHREIWTKIEHVALRQHNDPYIGNILPYFTGNEDLKAYLLALVGLLDNVYQIHSFNFKGYRDHAERVYNAGKLYWTSLVSQKRGMIATPENFPKAVRKIRNVDQWIGSLLNDVREAAGETGTEGYIPIADSRDKVLARFDQQIRGEQVVLLPVGIPILSRHGLLPTPSFAVLHGLSSGGKSTLAQNGFCLGIALGMVANRIKGRVAINTLEMNIDQIIYRMAAALAGFNTFTLLQEPTKISKEDARHFRDYLEFVTQLPISIDPDTRIGPEDMNYRATALHMGDLGPLRFLNTDYLELFEFPKGTNKQREESALAAIAKEHFVLSQELQCGVLAVSQSQYKTHSETWIAGLYGTRGSRAVTHKADIVMEVVNYAALERAGTPYKVAKGLDATHLWILLQKYRGGPTNAAIPMGWMPEYNQVYDDTLDDWNNTGDTTIFDHLNEVYKLLSEHPTTQIVPIEDTPLHDLEMVGDGSEF